MCLDKLGSIKRPVITPYVNNLNIIDLKVRGGEKSTQLIRGQVKAVLQNCTVF